jgi:predicted ATP-grasp superfamily ATP-dependent carboligase
VTARVLVLDGIAPAAVAVVRSLVRAGHATDVLGCGRHVPAAAVRGCRRGIDAPSPDRDPDAWTRAVRALVGRCRYDVLLPVSDVTQVLLSRIAGDLPDGTTAALPVAGDVEALHDKTAVLDRAAALGIPVLERREGPDIATAPLPAVLKPGRSRRVGAAGAVGATARVIGERAELDRAATKLTAAGLGAYAEPWVPGVGRGVFLLLDGGKVLARFAHRRIREASPLGGPSAVCESAPADVELEAQAIALAANLGVSGPFMAEFRGEFLLEVNARYWGSLGLAIDAGVDFPALHVASLLGGRPTGPDTWRTGLRRRNLAFDLRYLASVLAGRPRGVLLPWPGRFTTLCRVMVDDSPGLLYRTDDPAPGREHFARLVREVFDG